MGLKMKNAVYKIVNAAAKIELSGSLGRQAAKYFAGMIRNMEY